MGEIFAETVSNGGQLMFVDWVTIVGVLLVFLGRRFVELMVALSISSMGRNSIDMEGIGIT